jgi:hypothetical protein
MKAPQEGPLCQVFCTFRNYNQMVTTIDRLVYVPNTFNPMIGFWNSGERDKNNFGLYYVYELTDLRTAAGANDPLPVAPGSEIHWRQVMDESGRLTTAINGALLLDITLTTEEMSALGGTNLDYFHLSSAVIDGSPPGPGIRSVRLWRKALAREGFTPPP